MKLGGIEISRKGIFFSEPTAAKSAASTDSSVETGLELGDTGTRILGGIIQDEYNQKLAGREGILVYDEMRRSDGTVSALVSAISLPIRSANWYVKAASEEPADKEVAEFVEECLFERQSISFDDMLRQALLSLPFGVMVFEKVYKVETFGGKEMIILDKLAPRIPKSIYKWAISAKPGTTPTVVDLGNTLSTRNTAFRRGITQIRSDGSIAEIPIEKLVIFVNEMEGENWWGKSILRAPYKHWFIKNTFYKIDAIAFERQGLGVPYAKMPEGFTDADRAIAENILKNLRANSQAYIVEPADYEIGFKDMMARTTRDPATSIQHHNREIMKSGLAQFIELGSSSGSGSRAVSTDHSDLFLKSLEAVATQFAGTMNKYCIKQLVDLNFDVKEYPTLEYSGITETDVAGLSTAYQTLTGAGGVKAGAEDEQFFRELLGLPARDQSMDSIEVNPAQMEPVIGPDGKPELNPDGSQKMQPKKPAVVPPTKTAPGAGKDDIEPDEKQDEDINDDLGLSEFMPDIKKKVYPERKQIRKALDLAVAHLPLSNALALTKGRIALSNRNGTHAKYFTTVRSELTKQLNDLRRKAFAEGNAFKGYRPLTFAEQKVDFDGIQQKIDELETQFTGAAKELMKDALDSFMKDLTLAVHKGDTTAIKEASIDVQNALAKIIKQASTDAYTYGKNNAAKEIGVKAMANPADIVQQIAVQADTIAQQQISQIVADAKNAYVEAANKNSTSTTDALAAAADAAQAAIDDMIADTGTIMMAGYVGTGRNDLFDANGDSLYALQRSEILDKNTCNYCLSIDGRVIEIDDPFGQNTIFHSGCRGIWVAILKDESELPDIGGIPQTLRDRFGDAVNDLIQPRDPITRKDSLARQEADRRARAK